MSTFYVLRFTFYALLMLIVDRLAGSLSLGDRLVDRAIVHNNALDHLWRQEVGLVLSEGRIVGVGEAWRRPVQRQVEQALVDRARREDREALLALEHRAIDRVGVVLSHKSIIGQV